MFRWLATIISVSGGGASGEWSGAQGHRSR